MIYTMVKEKVSCWRCGGNVVDFGYDEHGCIQCGAPYDNQGNPVYPITELPKDESPLHSPRHFGKNGGYM